MTVRNLNSDQFALLEFKDRIGGPQIVLADNWTASTSVCNWIGVSCGILHKRVIALNLTSMNLRGTIPPHLGNLSFLLSLDLSSNHFYGHLPKELGHLHRLRILQLSYNRLNGEIPSWLGNLQRVRRLEMKNNNFTGTIPETLVNMSNLEILNLGFNQLSGQLNSLEGQIPSSIFNSTTLEGIELFNNKLEGNLPPITNAPKLEILALWGNKLRGNIPNSISNASMLKILDLEDNLFSGPIPKTLGNLRHLEWFQIMNNNLITGSATDHEWSFLSSLTNCNITNLLLLQLRHNKLSGFIPASIGGLRNLQALDLSSNKLGGHILESLCDLERLYEMYLGLNKLHGSIPSCLDILEIDLSSNHLQNSHAIDVGNLRSLLKLNLSRNLLSGDTLSSFGGLQTLVSLDLSNNILHGYIPKSFDGLISLEFLDLCNNNLSGVIPKSLEKLLYLKYFNVSFNRLEGEIPSKGCFSNFSSTSFMKNYALCGPPRLLVPPCKNDIHKNSQMIILHAFRYGLPTIGIVVVLIVLTIMYRRCRRRSTSLPIKDDLLSLITPRRISHAELSRATNGFEESNMLGSGSFGYVYKGRLSDGMEVAIKVFNLQTEGAFSSFDIECDAMRNIVHRNIVKVITCCSSVDFKALVLAYMSNGNLEKWLHSENCFLDIIQRVDIMIDVAVAIEHLHNGHPTPIIHCDIKPSNILLDEDMVAHVGDCGVAKLLGEGEVMKQTMTLATIGYIAPEFGSVGIVSIKSDIYSYGIVLIETFTKKKPTDNVFVEEETELPEERKDMKDVVVELKKIKQRLLNNIQHF
ncbi:hypothetical protein V6Z11_D05G378000 [Gossypium hirsutum]